MTFKKRHIPWNKGKKLYYDVWNKGLTKETDDRIKKQAENLKGHIVTKETRKKMKEAKKGYIPWMKGKKHTEKSKKKESKTKKRLFREGNLKPWNKEIKGYSTSWKGKHHTKKTKRKLSEQRLGKHFSPETEFKKGQCSGEKNPFYGKKHTKETKEKYKLKRKNWVCPKTDTKIEVKIQNFLKKLGIEFFTHQYMKIEHGYQCDILIPYMNLVIECDGDYWHKYPIGNDLDHIRTKELIKKGFKVLRLWEFEIKELNIDDFENKLKNFK